MKQTILPSVHGTVTNSLSLNREIARAVSSVEVVFARSGKTKIPAGKAALIAVFEAAIDYIEGSIKLEEGPPDLPNPPEPPEDE